MFDDVACVCLSLTLPGWLLCLCLTCSMCACAQWLICCALAHKASLLTFVIAIADCCCRHCLCAMRYKNAVRLRPRPCCRHSSSSLPIVVVIVAIEGHNVNMWCACAQGLVIRHSLFVVAIVKVIIAIARCNVSTARAFMHIAFGI
jgi:hypothetical protein